MCPSQAPMSWYVKGLGDKGGPFDPANFNALWSQTGLTKAQLAQFNAT